MGEIGAVVDAAMTTAVGNSRVSGLSVEWFFVCVGVFVNFTSDKKASVTFDILSV
jgi:hypothetical protein